MRGRCGRSEAVESCLVPIGKDGRALVFFACLVGVTTTQGGVMNMEPTYPHMHLRAVKRLSPRCLGVFSRRGAGTDPAHS